MLRRLIARRALSLAIAAASVGAVAGGSYIAADALGDDEVEHSLQAEGQSTPLEEDADESDTAAESDDAAEDAAGTGEERKAAERFHGDETEPCALPEGSTLTGDWNHGQYVSGWARSGEPGAAATAARSRCGKPAHAGGRDRRADDGPKVKKDRIDGDGDVAKKNRRGKDRAAKARGKR